MMDHLELLLLKQYQDMPFEHINNQIWWVFALYMCCIKSIFSIGLDRCFPHIVNLACHDVKWAIDEMQYGSRNQGVLANIDWNPIASLHTLIKSVSRWYFLW